MLGLRYNFFDAKYGVQDADGDGVADEADQCPGTPRGVQVDSVGCPLDGDKDGVADYLDKCPNTPAGEEVDAQGCSLDGDGDGVVDADDMCPDTPAGTEVMSNGCGGEQSVVLRGVNFELNSAQLTVNAETILDGVAATLSSSPGFNVELQGHTDSMGSDSYNMNLSQNRAKSVKNYLVNQGVESGRLTARGYRKSAQRVLIDIPKREWADLHLAPPYAYNAAQLTQKIEPWCSIQVDAADMKRLWRSEFEVKAKSEYDHNRIRDLYAEAKTANPDMTQNALVEEVQLAYADQKNSKEPSRSTVQRVIK